MTKELCITTDFPDNLLRAGHHFTKKDIDALMAYSSSLGASRHEWVFDPMWSFHSGANPAGFDVLKTACEAAHRHGMRFDAVFKPFEGALCHPLAVLPSTMP